MTRVLCAWCNSTIPGAPVQAGDSHGICWTCAAREFPGALEQIRRQCAHSWELQDREHQEDEEPESMDGADRIHYVRTASHLDRNLCELCGAIEDTVTACDCEAEDA